MEPRIITAIIVGCIVSIIFVRKIPRKKANRSYEAVNRERYCNEFILMFIGLWLGITHSRIDSITAYFGEWLNAFFLVGLVALYLFARLVYKLKSQPDPDTPSVSPE